MPDLSLETSPEPDVPSPQTHTGKVARAASLVMALFLVSRAAGLLREMVIAGQFGTSAELDAYLAAFRLPDLLFALMAGGALASAFIPVFTEYLARDDQKGAWLLASAVINWVILFLSAAGILAALGAPMLVTAVIAPGFSPDQQALTAQLMRWMLVSTAIFGVSGVVMGILNARQHFFLPAVAPIVYNAAIIAGAWILGPFIGVRGAAVGVVVGAAGHLLVQIPGLRRAKMQYTLRLAPHDPGVREVGRLMLPRALGLAAVELNHLVNVILASGLAAGSLSALNFGRLMMLLPEGVIAQSVAIAAFPTFSVLVARKQRDELRRVLVTTLRGVLYLTLPATIGLIWLREPIVGTFLQHGAFNAQSTQAVAWALLFYAFGLVSHAMVEIVTRAFYALHDTRTPVAVGILSMVANVALSLCLMPTFRLFGLPPFGGLALANTIATTVEMVVLLYLINRQLNGLGNGRMTRSIGRMAVGSIVMLLSLAGFTTVFSAASIWVISLAGIAAGAVVYGVVTLALGSEEPVTLLERLKHRLR